MISSLPLLRVPHSCICRLVLDSAELVFRRIYSFKLCNPMDKTLKKTGKMHWNTQRHQCVCADKNYYTIYSVLPDSRSEPNTQALLTPGHSVSLQSVHLRGLTVEKEMMKEGMNRKNSALSRFSDICRLLMLKTHKTSITSCCYYEKLCWNQWLNDYQWCVSL